MFRIVLVILFFTGVRMAAAQVRNDDGIRIVQDTPLHHVRIERTMIYTPGADWLYNHHASITHFRDLLIAIWSDGMKDEDQPGQRVVFATSRDFVHWSKPEVLASPSRYRGDTANVLTAAGFHTFGDSLVAYYGEYSPHRTHTHLWAKVSRDGMHWSMARDMRVAVNPNHGPQRAAGGRLIISGNFTFPYTDDPTGLSGWKMSSFYPDSLFHEDNPATFYSPATASGLPPLCEGSFFADHDDVLHMLLRVTGKGWKGRLWVTNSKDNGAHWSRPVPSGFSDNDSKFHFGRWPDKRWYYVGIPDSLHHYDRTPLVLALSNDGRSFDQCFLLANEAYQLKAEGLWKGGQYGYPHTMIYDGFLYVIVSRQKESIELLRMKIDEVKKR